ncbi:hypothetical protein MRX96_001050 [Rhipicephalus microplus]
MSRLSVRALRVLTPASALASLVANAIALCSNSWLHSTELMPNPSYNGSGDREQLAKNTESAAASLVPNGNRETRRNNPGPKLGSAGFEIGEEKVGRDVLPHRGGRVRLAELRRCL